MRVLRSQATLLVALPGPALLICATSLPAASSRPCWLHCFPKCHKLALQVKEQVQEFKDRQAVISKAESLAASYTSREAALTTREQKVTEQEDSAQRANAAAEYARTEADAMWQKQKVCLGNNLAQLRGSASAVCSYAIDASIVLMDIVLRKAAGV